MNNTDDYTLRTDEDGDIVVCASCECGVPVGNFSNPSDEKEYLLCEFCSKTFASSYTHAKAYDEQGWLRAEIWKAAAAVANYLKHGL